MLRDVSKQKPREEKKESRKRTTDDSDDGIKQLELNSFLNNKSNGSTD